jgi:hypothetical protein
MSHCYCVGCQNEAELERLRAENEKSEQWIALLLAEVEMLRGAAAVLVKEYDAAGFKRRRELVSELASVLVDSTEPVRT